MDFEKTYKKIEPNIRAMINSIKYRPSYIDEEDLLQEVSIYLWKVWKENGFAKNTDSYILQGGKFYLKNYIRCADDKFNRLSIDEVIDEREHTLKDVLPDNFSLEKYIENKIFLEEILKNGLSKREKQVLFYLWKGYRYKTNGYTTREIGKLLGISHVRVIKIKENINKKIKKYLKGVEI
jgi:RNA polymerase sigma factor (sigma-70 family)